MDAIKRHLQTRCLPLNEYQWSIDTLPDEIEQNKRSHGRKIYGTKFQSTFISPDIDILPDPHFESELINYRKEKKVS